MSGDPNSTPIAFRIPHRLTFRAFIVGCTGHVVLSLSLLSVLVAAGSGCGRGGSEGASADGQRPLTPVVISSPFKYEFSDRVEALGSAKANESVIITARVAETVSQVHFEDGQHVESGAILVEFERTEEVAQLAGARANRVDAKNRFDRVADLAKSGTVSASRYDEARAALEAADAHVAELNARISDLRVRAPFAGMLGLREVSPGTFVQPGERITTLDDIDSIKLDFSVPEIFFAMLRPGLKVHTHAAAYPGRVFEGEITAIDSRIDPNTRAVRVRAKIDNQDHAIRPGMLMTLVLHANPMMSVALVEQALVPRGTSQFVMVLDGDDVAQRVEVKIGRRVPGLVEILSGLDVGARVIIDGANLVRPGVAVRVLREETPPRA